MICLKIRTFVVSATTLWKSINRIRCCDLLENSYLCSISNNSEMNFKILINVVICLKIRTFVVSATTHHNTTCHRPSCDLLENSYLCSISNNDSFEEFSDDWVVICLKIRTFVVSATTWSWAEVTNPCCDLLENSYLCSISNNQKNRLSSLKIVVICLKIRTFVVSATTEVSFTRGYRKLWFAWKFVPL